MKGGPEAGYEHTARVDQPLGGALPTTFSTLLHVPCVGVRLCSTTGGKF